MENAPVITMNAGSRYPGADPEVYERFLKWWIEVYGQVSMRVPQRRQVDMYQVLQESPLFPANLWILHYENYAVWENARKNPEAISISSEFISWMKRGIIDTAWSAVYQLIKSYRSDISKSEEQPDTRIENASFLHLEAYRLTVEDSEKYSKWFSDYCSNVFIPLFMKQPGLQGYDYYKHIGIAVNYENLMEKEYPAYLSAIYFENIRDFENFEKSSELAICRKTLRNIFPSGLNYKWYVQCELARSLKR
jgi:hypothetical protein